MHSVQWHAMISQPADGWHKSHTKKHLEFKNMQSAIQLFQPHQHVGRDPNKSLTLTIIVQYMQNIYIIFNISILTFIYLLYL